jgi:hypothetical protein
VPTPETPATRTERATAWTVHHFGELTAVGVPLVLTVTTSAWFAVLTTVSAAWWVAHDIRVARALRTTTTPLQLTSTTTATNAGSHGKESA